MSLIKYNQFPCLFCVCVCVIISANLALEFVISFFRVIVAVVISGRCSFSSLSNLLILNPGIWIITTCAQHKNLNKIWWQNIHSLNMVYFVRKILCIILYYFIMMTQKHHFLNLIWFFSLNLFRCIYLFILLKGYIGDRNCFAWQSHVK